MRVRELREQSGIGQKQLAIDLCVTQPTVSDWESGKKVPSAKSTQKIADYFNVSIDYLLGRNTKHRLRELREQNELTQTDVATYLKVARNTISRYESGEREPDNETLNKLADYYNCSIDYLLGRTDDKTAYKGKETDIADDLEKMVRELELQPDGLMYQGHPMNRETREILIANLRSTIELSKKFAREGKPTSREKIDELWRNIELLNEGEIDG